MGYAFLAFLLALAGGGAVGKKNGRVNGNGKKKKAKKKKIAAKKKKKKAVVVEPPKPDDGEEWLEKIDELFPEDPVAERFYQIKTGVNASQIARALLRAAGGSAADTGSNRLALIKCLTKVPWNQARYAAERTAQGWGTLYDVDGRNLSAAFLPRHALAMQWLSQGLQVPRSITNTGASAPDAPSGYYGALWLPKVSATANGITCDTESGPPEWLTKVLQ